MDSFGTILNRNVRWLVAIQNELQDSHENGKALEFKFINRKRKFKKNYFLLQPTIITGWVMSSACLLYLIYGLYNTELSQLYAAAFSSLSHSAWAASLAWIVVACSTGYGGYINTLLSAPCIYPFSRVTYCAYLVHPIVIRLLALNSDAPLHLGSDSMVRK